MPYRDEHGHFISAEEAQSRGLIPATSRPGEAIPEVIEVAATDTQPAQRLTWVDEQALTQRSTVFIDTGRGQSKEVPVGSPFQPTIEAIAEEAHYGGYFRVFLNGSEVVNPGDAPATIEAGQRISLAAYDKVGLN